MITVYTKDFCPRVMAKKQLADMGFEYEEINIEADAKTRNWLIEQGHLTSFPNLPPPPPPPPQW